MKYAVLGVLAVIGGLAGCSKPPAQVNMLTGITLSNEEAIQLRAMQMDGHYGVMVRAPSGVWAWTAGYNDMAAARADAMSMCNQDPLAGGECQVIVELVPLGEPLMIGGKTVTIDTAQEFADHEPRIGASAFAIAADGTHGHGWGYDTLEGAEARALMECNSRNEARALEAMREGLPTYPCEVVWTKPAPSN